MGREDLIKLIHRPLSEELAGIKIGDLTWASNSLKRATKRKGRKLAEIAVDRLLQAQAIKP